jgi:hypothetical protein
MRPLLTRRASPLRKQRFGDATLALPYRDLAKNERHVQEATCTPHQDRRLCGGAHDHDGPGNSPRALKRVTIRHPANAASGIQTDRRDTSELAGTILGTAQRP